MSIYLFRKHDMDMNWLAQYDYQPSSGQAYTSVFILGQ